MHDQHGKLLVTAMRSRNKLYKVRMGLKNTSRLYLTADSESCKWRARLGHINYETIRSMMQKELVLGLPTVNIEKKSMWIVSSWEKESPSLSKGNIIPSCYDTGATIRRLFWTCNTKYTSWKQICVRCD